MRQSKLNLKARQSGHLPKFAAVAILLLAGIPAISRAQQPGQKTFASAEHFLDSGALGETECLILDVRMPGMSGLDLQRRLKSSESAVPIIFITAHDDNANRRQAIDAGAVDFFGKPFEAAALVAAVRTALAGNKERSAGQGL